MVISELGKGNLLGSRLLSLNPAVLADIVSAKINKNRLHAFFSRFGTDKRAPPEGCVSRKLSSRNLARKNIAATPTQVRGIYSCNLKKLPDSIPGCDSGTRLPSRRRFLFLKFKGQNSYNTFYIFRLLMIFHSIIS